MEDVGGWHITGDGRAGDVVGPDERFPYRLDDGMVKVWLPWEVDLERLKRALGEGGWAVARGTERAGYTSWGEAFDVEGYYPQWLAPDPERPGHTVFGFAPRDYRAESPEEVAPVPDATEAPAGPDVAAAPVAAPPSPNHPYLGPEGLREFLRWLPYLRQARSG